MNITSLPLGFSSVRVVAGIVETFGYENVTRNCALRFRLVMCFLDVVGCSMTMDR